MTQNMDALRTDVPSPMQSMSSARSNTSSASASPRPYVSKVGILPSSLPAYHKEYLEREKAGTEDDTAPLPAPNEPTTQPRSQAEQEEMARRLKPHSRSQLRLDESNKRPQGLTPVNLVKKPKPIRWQFGIRSRNAPWEALVCIYKALHKLGCGWIVDEDFEQLHGRGNGDTQYVHSVYMNVALALGGLTSSIRNGNGSFADSEYGAPFQREGDSDDARRYKLPADPWHIKVRWTTESESHAPQAPLAPCVGATQELLTVRLNRAQQALRLVEPAQARGGGAGEDEGT